MWGGIIIKKLTKEHLEVEGMGPNVVAIPSNCWPEIGNFIDVIFNPKPMRIYNYVAKEQLEPITMMEQYPIFGHEIKNIEPDVQIMWDVEREVTNKTPGNILYTSDKYKSKDKKEKPKREKLTIVYDSNIITNNEVDEIKELLSCFYPQ